MNYLEKNVFCGACSVMSFPGDVNELQRVGAFDEDGVIATGASNKLVRVWDATSGQVGTTQLLTADLRRSLGHWLDMLVLLNVCC